MCAAVLGTGATAGEVKETVPLIEMMFWLEHGG